MCSTLRLVVKLSVGLIGLVALAAIIAAGGYWYLRQSLPVVNGTVTVEGVTAPVEIVRDRSSKAPFDPARQTHARVKREGMARGLMTYPMGGTIDGVHGDHVLLAPPFIVEEAHLDEIVGLLAASIDAAIASP